jgi:two-component system phosphate regulon sensor histidine kinase PhoR
VIWILLILCAALLGTQHWWLSKRQHQLLAEAQKKEADESLRLRQELYDRLNGQQQALFNSMIEGVLLLDGQERIQLLNESLRKCFGVTTDIRGQTIMEAFRWHELAEVAARLRREKTITEAELEIQRGARRCFHVSGAMVGGRDGPPGQLFVFHDVTRLKELENLRQEFVGNVSHELRTPLSLIKGFAQTLLDGALENPAQATRFLQKIDAHSDRLLFLIEDLLAISHLESGRIPLNFQQIHLRETAQRVLEDLGAGATARHTVLDNQISDSTVIWADGDRLHQVLFNLTQNAIKYGKSPGKVIVGAREMSPEKIEVFVSDDGPGIPPDSIERVFERFYRVDRARSRDTGGTGLGLAIVKHIVQAHGGEVGVKSELQKGCTFHFTLPRRAINADKSRPEQ